MEASETGRAPASSFSRNTAVDLLAISLLWSLAVFVVRPIGDFPLNDDWSFGMTVKRLVEGQGYQPGRWSEMTLITHVLWGALFCSPFGFSFTVLRFSTLTLSLVGALAMYGLIRQLKAPRLLAAIGALTLAFNPVYFALSNTFMTDVPFTTLTILSAWFFVRYLQRAADLDLLVGTAFAVAAMLSRQMALCLPIAFGITVCLQHRFKRRWLVRAVLPSFICLVILALYLSWFKTSGHPAASTTRTAALWATLADPVKIPLMALNLGPKMLLYLGWFIAPIMVLGNVRQPGGWSPLCLPAAVAAILGVFLALAQLVISSSMMPVHGNIIIPQGIGPATLHDVVVLHQPHLRELPGGFWLVVTFVSFAGAAILIYQTVRMAIKLFPGRRFDRTNADGATAMFFLLGAVIYLTPFMLSSFFDRYLIPMTVFVIGFFAATRTVPEEASTIQKGVAVLLLVGFGLFAVVGTRDYLECNRTRGRAVNALLAQKGVSPQIVDGGFEFNGWYGFDRENISSPSNYVSGIVYVLAYAPIEGYNFDIVDTYRYKTWLPPGESQIFVLKLKTGQQ